MCIDNHFIYIQIKNNHEKLIMLHSEKLIMLHSEKLIMLHSEKLIMLHSEKLWNLIFNNNKHEKCFLGF